MEDRANDLEALRLSMEVAAANGDFERAADLRDRISLCEAHLPLRDAGFGQEVKGAGAAAAVADRAGTCGRARR